ncbi:RNA polymerase sigma-70 factor, ECF subfamily [Pseudomonas saponiphila]|uniref:RNA polymerase sigma-70 factor, ECF subfamily n=2 Tax=Pseudomonas saponiphila TaxID=556534 RepID=A0A1H4VH26_9PSED|nr:RNA polymerase sigma-70 factor, ECF subfamily [Pseudomonas saponiphila]
MNCSMQEGLPTRLADHLFEASWKAVLPGLQRRARQLARGNADGAQEWLAATAIKALLFFRRSPERIRDPQGFLFLVLDHVFVDSCRRRAREQRLFVDFADFEDDPLQQLEAPQMSVLEQVELLETLALLSQRVAQLPVKKRRLFELKFVDDLPYPNIAAELGMNQPLARKHVQLLREALR